MSEKVKSVEGLRGLACLAVLLSHLSLIFYPFLHGQKSALIKTNLDKFIANYPIGFFYAGTSAVFVFFCLSGYILTYACVKKGNVLESSTKMILARYIRLVLPVLASVIICYAVIKYFPDNTSNLPWISSWGHSVTENDGLLDAIYNGLFSSVFLSDNKYNWVIWTMQIELLGSYLLLSALPVICRFKHCALICIAICTIFILCQPTKTGISYASFFLGAAIYWVKEIKNKLLSVILLLIGLYLAGFKELSSWYIWLNEMLYIDLPGGKNNTYYFVPLLSGFVLVLVAVKSTAMKYVVECDFSALLGRLSFSAYLIQIPVFYIAAPLLKSFFLTFSNNYDFIALSSIGMSLVIVYLISFIFAKVIDNNCIKLSRVFSAYFTIHKTPALKEYPSQ
ncbi:TPA: acyltransferase [Escherichia coli]|jgi:Predicted acyltransferases|uniref:acyltransferase family protein n=1 Tax=Escherichia coli TaxID=562 RepID=UPI0019AE82FA|nr:acyltransferase [Escherichia coli]EFU9410058.1 acyltransferase [Escherichia coli]HAM7669414.1 acyltransferase [Escherichia coli]HBB2793041.1 acyltransferase [Escherichia coli]HEI3357619.1 acyltransferase [Escherichia coli]